MALDMPFVGVGEDEAVVYTGTTSTRNGKLLRSIWWPNIFDKSITDFAIQAF